MTYNILATGSRGNAVVIDRGILIDCGVPRKALEAVKQDLKLVLLTHVHSDHFNPRTVRALSKERPALRFGCCEWMVAPLLQAGVEAHRIDLYTPGVDAEYWDVLTIRPEPLLHNVPNCGYHMTFLGCDRLFYATDASTLEGIEAPGYNLYMVEANHTKQEIRARQKAKRDALGYAYEYEAEHNHLSREQAEDWLYSQMAPWSRYVFLHGHIDNEGGTK